jgi:hypothetical protein
MIGFELKSERTFQELTFDLVKFIPMCRFTVFRTIPNLQREKEREGERIKMNSNDKKT